ncbi:cuticle protein-like isoform X1 [Amphibalanus amphitrite]|uniref:cuticle protein-like isoform X1 n=1 Tax=Amphibalanus amphitrite TaxID=1232801 RepID=UPI001C91A8DF|nr:cuticle protein-like isoform X1 [Amphibalanus amphitrite]
MMRLVVLSALVAAAAAAYYDYNLPLTYAASPYAAAPLTYAAAPYAAAPYAASPLTYAAAPYAASPLTYAAAPVAAAPAPYSFSRRYQTQDELGQATFGHEEPNQSHAAVRDAFGNVAGSYSYINPEGQTISVKYTAGEEGVQVESNALPVAPIDTGKPPVDTGVPPAPVQATPEVQAATAAHLAAVMEAEQMAAAPEMPGAAPEMMPGAAPEMPEMMPGAASEMPGAAPGMRKRRALLYTAAAAAPAAGYAAEKTEVILNPGHATSYRVDPVAPALLRKRRGVLLPSLYSGSALLYAAPAAAAAPAAGYAAEKTEVILNPGHATSYRVDPLM